MNVIPGAVPTVRRPRLPGELIDWVATAARRTPADLLGERRDDRIADLRSVCAILFREQGVSFPMIGRRLGGRDHSTVRNLISRWPRRVLIEPGLEAFLDRARAFYAEGALPTAGPAKVPAKVPAEGAAERVLPWGMPAAISRPQSQRERNHFAPAGKREITEAAANLASSNAFVAALRDAAKTGAARD